MNKEQIRMEIEEIASQICMINSADATCLPEKVIDWMTNRFIEDYEDEDVERLPDDSFVMKQMCNYLQEEV